MLISDFIQYSIMTLHLICKRPSVSFTCLLGWKGKERKGRGGRAISNVNPHTKGKSMLKSISG